MRKMLPFSLLALAFLTGCLDSLAPTVAPNFDALDGFIFVDSDGGKTALEPFDYAHSTRTTAISVTDPLIPNAVLTTAGTVAFVFDQKLVGATIETPIYQQQIVNGQPVDITIGKGDYNGAFKVIVGYTPQPKVIAYQTDSDTNLSLPVRGDNTGAYPTYRPDGVWPIGPADTIWDFPPSAINVFGAINNEFPSNSIIVVHLLANVVRGVSGQLIGPARNAAGTAITVTLSDGSVAEVAASVIFQTP